MERHRQLDPARRPAAGSLNRVIRWLCPLIVPLLAAEDADAIYRRGMDLARERRWSEARTALASGSAAHPRDKRFPLELAGIAWKRDDLPTAKRHLRRALALDSANAYANSFLASIYLLEDNLEAALKFWNRTGQPELTTVQVAPGLRVQPALLDGAFVFSPAATLQRRHYLASRARLDQLGIFPRYRFHLTPADGNSYTFHFQAAERNGFGSTAPDRFLNLLRGVFFQTVYPEYYNWRDRAINFESILRWDLQKQRARFSVAGPVDSNPGTRARLYLDASRETWDISRTFRNAIPVDGLALRRAAIGAEVRSIVSARWSRWTGVELSWRGLPNRALFGVADNSAFAPGLAPSLHAGAAYSLLRVPDRRFTLAGESAIEAGKTLRRGLDPFVRLQTSLEANWLPRSRGEDFAFNARLGAGKLLGDAPFDRLFQLGVERDNDLWLRGHAGTAAGRKGNAPIGRQFVLANWEIDKEVYRGGFLTVAAGPMLDTGQVWDNRDEFGSSKWLIDTGLQCKIRLLTGATLIFSWGKDLRSGRNTFYARLGR